MNAVEIEQAVSELAEAPFDAEEFPYAFLEAFGNKSTTLKKLRSGASNKSDLGGVLQRNNIHIKVCSGGAVGDTLTELRNSPATAKGKVKIILATDGQDFQAEDLNSGEIVDCSYEKFHDHFGFFLPLAGISTVKQIRESSFDIKATGRLNKLYVQLLKDNPDWGTREKREKMNHFMARLIFCFFAEDTDIFSRSDLFTDTVDQMSESDASNTHEIIMELFRAMNTPFEKRETEKIARWADELPYVNGGLFAGSLDVPKFTRIARSYLIHIGGLDWKKINPDIFGSMIQAVADDEERGELGMHYTSVPNILKVLNPLFLDDLREQLESAGDNGRKLLNLRNRLAKIRVFDPACGSGNFLVIAYKQMREIEAVINERRGESDQRSVIPVTNFRGIEIRNFSAEVARLALIIAEYQCDVLYRELEDVIKDFLPLRVENWITCANALQIDWLSVCPPTGTDVQHRGEDLLFEADQKHEVDFENEGGETYICGNPPYLGAKKKSSEQIEDMERVGLSKAKLLDYICAFIVKGLDMVRNTQSGMALVSTSSICQGEQVSLLWPIVFKDANIQFAYRPFKWANSAVNNAGVWCTIVGIFAVKNSKKYLYSTDRVQECDNIAPYLISGPDVICDPISSPLSPMFKMKMGSNPVDGKKLILEEGHIKDILKTHPEAMRFIKPYGGTKELVSGFHRWCVWIEDEEVEAAMKITPIEAIIKDCEKYRRNAGRDAQKAANRPHAFCYNTFEDRPFVQVGNTIGNTFEYVPADIKNAGYVTNHAAFTIYGVRLVEFAVVVSSLHRVWAETVAGRLGNGIRYGNTVVYNTFPVPTLTEKNKADLTRCAENILLAREAHFPKTIADLYDPEKMPANLREAHEQNDETLERIYIGRRFKNDTERLEKLFELYTKMTASPKKAAKA